MVGPPRRGGERRKPPCCNPQHVSSSPFSFVRSLVLALRLCLFYTTTKLAKEKTKMSPNFATPCHFCLQFGLGSTLLNLTVSPKCFRFVVLQFRLLLSAPHNFFLHSINFKLLGLPFFY